MGRKDTIEKGFVSDNEIFADVVNATVFSGKQVVHPEDLKEQDSTEVYSELINGKLLSAQKYRDVLKYVTIRMTDNCCYALIGMENQTSVNRAMPVRNMVYDSINYITQVEEIVKKHREEDKAAGIRDSIEGFREEDTIIPVITIVVYFGTGRWDGPRSLHELFPKNTPEEVKKLAADHKITVLAPKEVEDLQIFHNDNMQAVAKALADADDVEKLYRLIQEDPVFSKVGRKAAMVIQETTPVKIRIPEHCKEVNMSEAVKAYEDKLRAEGRDAGKAEGEADGVKKTEDAFAQLSAAMQEYGCPSDDIIRTMSDAGFRKEMMAKFGVG